MLRVCTFRIIYLSVLFMRPRSEKTGTILLTIVSLTQVKKKYMLMREWMSERKESFQHTGPCTSDLALTGGLICPAHTPPPNWDFQSLMVWALPKGLVTSKTKAPNLSIFPSVFFLSMPSRKHEFKWGQIKKAAYWWRPGLPEIDTNERIKHKVPF